MLGVGSNDENTIPSLLSSVSKGKFHVINYGEASYNAYQGFQLLQLESINGLKPDLVVSYDGVNNRPSLGRKYFSHIRESQISQKIEKNQKWKIKNFDFFPIFRTRIHKDKQENADKLKG